MDYMAPLLMTLLMCMGLLMIFIVLLQRGRGGGLAGAFGGLGGQSAFGTKAGDVFTKITVGIAIAWVVLAAISGLAVRAAVSKVADEGSFKNPDDVPTLRAGGDADSDGDADKPGIEDPISSGGDDTTPPGDSGEDEPDKGSDEPTNGGKGTTPTDDEPQPTDESQPSGKTPAEQSADSDFEEAESTNPQPEPNPFEVPPAGSPSESEDSE